MIITTEIFEAAAGRPHENDDLERSNCKDAGKVGHQFCGWNQEKNLPNFMGPPLPIRKD